jgi:hypothetical protein
VSKLSKFIKVSDNFTVNRYDNGFMLEVSGRDSNEDWQTAKIICTTEPELLALIQEVNSINLDA